MSCESECVEISMMVEIFVEDFLGIISTLVRLFGRAIIVFISDREFSESAVVLGKTSCQREVHFLILIIMITKLQIVILMFARKTLICGFKFLKIVITF